jgi:hypothetical protein
MKRNLFLATALLAGAVLALFLAHARGAAYPQPPPALVTCDNWVTCPEHNVSSTWTRKTKEVWDQKRMQLHLRRVQPYRGRKRAGEVA